MLFFFLLGLPFLIAGYAFFALTDQDTDSGLPAWAVLLLGFVVVVVTVVAGLYALTRVGYVGQVLGFSRATTDRILGWGDALIEPVASLLTIRIGAGR